MRHLQIQPATRISQIGYNPAARAFEARVTLTEDGHATTYPISLRAPMDADYGDLRRAMSQLALRRHRQRTPGMCSHTMLDAPRRAPRPDSLPARLSRRMSRSWDAMVASVV